MKDLDLTITILADTHDELLSRAISSAAFAKHILVINNNPKPLPKEFWKTNLDSHHQQEPITSFAKTRNKALEKVHTEWTMFLDSDEQITPDLRQEIISVIQKNEIDGLKIKRLDVFHNEVLHHGETGNITILRLARTKKFRFEGNVHEVGKVTGKVSQSKFHLLHFAHPNITDFIQKIAQYSKLVSETKNTKNFNNTLQLITFPIAKFIYNYIFRLGLLDGWRGFCYAIIMSIHSASVRIYTHEKLL